MPGDGPSCMVDHDACSEGGRECGGLVPAIVDFYEATIASGLGLKHADHVVEIFVFKLVEPFVDKPPISAF